MPDFSLTSSRFMMIAAAITLGALALCAIAVRGQAAVIEHPRFAWAKGEADNAPREVPGAKLAQVKHEPVGRQVGDNGADPHPAGASGPGGALPWVRWTYIP